MRKKRVRCIAALLAALLTALLCSCDERAQEPVSARILCPNLGKADGFLILSDGHAVLIDTGEDPDAKALLALMDAWEVTRLDAMILTHFDKDHIGGAAKLLETMEIETVYQTSFTEDSEAYTAYLSACEASDALPVTLTETVSFSLGMAEFTLYPPLQETYDKNQDNNSSIIVSMSCARKRALFAGDAQKQRIKEFLKSQYDGGSYDFVKVPHHGKDTKVFSQLLDCFVPEYAVVTSSWKEPEDDELLSLLHKNKTKVYLTRKGAVNVCITDKEIDITQKKS